MDTNLLSKLERSVECDICHDPVDDPRTLPCQHTYCRFCIDDLLKFDENGVATVKCPKKCGETVISCNDTTKTLPKPFALLNVLDLINEIKQNQPNKETKKCSCQSQISKWCISCKNMSCFDCYQKHECKKASFIHGRFEEINEVFQPLCEEHDARIIKLCVDCDEKFICCYCFHRNHSLHKVETLEQTAYDYKQEYFAELDKINVQELNFSYDDVVGDILQFEEQLKLEMNARMLQKVSSYVGELTRQKDAIFSEYKQAINEYKQSLKQSESTKRTFKQSVISAREYLQKQSAFETLATKDELTLQRKAIENVESFKVSLVENGNSLETIKTEQFTNHLTKRCDVFEHDIDMGNVENYCGIMNNTVAVMLGLLESSKELYITKEEETSIQNYCSKDINALITKNDIKMLKKVIQMNSIIVENNFSRLLTMAINSNRSNILDLLLNKYGKDIDEELVLEKLYNAVEKGSAKCVERLLQCRASSDTTYHPYILHKAASIRNGNILNMLLDELPNELIPLNNKDICGQTPLMNAVCGGNKICVELLLNYGADVNIKDNEEDTGLHHAASDGYDEILTLLLQNGADVDCEGSKGQTPLMKAVINGFIDCVDVLLENHAAVNRKDKFNYTCLHHATWKSHHEILISLLQYSVDIDSKGFRGRTPLINASIYGSKECVNALLQHNADINLKDDKDATPLNHAKKKGHHETVNILLLNGAE